MDKWDGRGRCGQKITGLFWASFWLSCARSHWSKISQGCLPQSTPTLKRNKKNSQRKMNHQHWNQNWWVYNQLKSVSLKNVGSLNNTELLRSQSCMFFCGLNPVTGRREGRGLDVRKLSELVAAVLTKAEVEKFTPLVFNFHIISVF